MKKKAADENKKNIRIDLDGRKVDNNGMLSLLQQQ